MFSARRRSGFRPPFGPPIVVMGAAALISLAAAQLASAAPLPMQLVAAAPDCQSPHGAARAAGRHLGAAPLIADNIDGSGQLAGRAITGNAQGGKQFSIALPVESAVTPANGDALVYTRATGGKSEVHLVDLATGCDALLARPGGTARSAVLGPAADVVYVHSVSFPARADLGVARYALDGSSSQPVVPPLPGDDRFGVTFGTQLGWSTDGATLFVQSCGASQCRTRLLDVAAGSITLFDADGQGQIIGVTPNHLVTYAGCGGLPCGVLSIDRATGATATLADEAWSASFDGTAVRIETAAWIVEVEQ